MKHFPTDEEIKKVAESEEALYIRSARTFLRKRPILNAPVLSSMDFGVHMDVARAKLLAKPRLKK